MTTSHARTVLLTDHPWPDDTVERAVIEGAGFTFAAGPSVPAPTEVIEALIADYHPAAVLTCRAPVSAAAIAFAPRLAIVARMGAGLDGVAVDAASERGVWVTHVPGAAAAEPCDGAGAEADADDAAAAAAAVDDVRRRAAEEVVRVLRGRPPVHPCNAPAGLSAADQGAAGPASAPSRPSGAAR